MLDLAIVIEGSETTSDTCTFFHDGNKAHFLAGLCSVLAIRASGTTLV